MDILTLSMAKKYTDESILGIDGVLKGEKGDPGHTPVRGVDYWTEEDKASIISEIDCASPILCQLSGSVVSANDASDMPMKGLTLYGKTTQDGTPTPEAPVELKSVGARGSITVGAVGTKNLFGGDALADKLVAEAQATKDEASGTVSYYCANVSTKRIFTAPNPDKQYTVILYGKNSLDDKKACNLAWLYTDGTYEAFNFTTAGQMSTRVLATNANKQVTGLIGMYNSGSTILHYDKCGIFEGVLTQADFEPYVGSTLTASTPNGLPGIPVSSGGNYTDENGQQWICDEIDFDKGVYVQRVDRLDLGTLSWGTDSGGFFQTHAVNKLENIQHIDTAVRPNALCTRYPVRSIYESARVGYDNISWYWVKEQSRTAIRVYDFTVADLTSFKQAVSGAIVQFILHEPIETPLPTEELAQYSALRTYKPNTTVYNDAGAGMTIGYVADTKMYIDNKLAAISAALLNA